MKIITYNVNGIRAAINKGFIDWLKASNPDMICLQEIKAEEHQIEMPICEHINALLQNKLTPPPQY